MITKSTCPIIYLQLAFVFIKINQNYSFTLNKIISHCNCVNQLICGISDEGF